MMTRSQSSLCKRNHYINDSAPYENSVCIRITYVCISTIGQHASYNLLTSFCVNFLSRLDDLCVISILVETGLAK